MAAIQKIRSKGVLLVSVIALALFLFVAGDLFRGLESLFRNSSMQVGEVNGKTLDIQQYQKLVEDYQTYYEVATQKSSFNEEELNRIKDEAWQTYVQSELIKSQCEEIGLAVTEEEISEVIRSGFSQMLQVPIFMNQQTGRYDYAQVSAFLKTYQDAKKAGNHIPDEYEKIHSYYLFAQRQIHDQLLAQKFQLLLSQSFLSNPVEAQMNFDGRTEEADIILAALPAASVKDDEVQVSDADLQAKYNEDKEQYQQLVETRDLKIVDIQVVASDKDKSAALADMQDAEGKLITASTNTAAGNVARQANSLIHYADIYKTKAAYPEMIANLLDSAAVGFVSPAKYDAMTNTYFTCKLLGKTTQPDSVLFRQIGVIGKDEADIAKKADSIMTALSSGASFKDIAKKYGQPGDSAWIASSQFENASLDADNASFISALFSMGAGSNKKLTLTNGNTIILQVDKTANPVTKYNVAAVVKELKFSDETYNNEFNKFSAFVAENRTLELIEANAPKSGYTVRPINDISTSSHNIAGIRATRDVVKWAFDEAKAGDISQLYECGSNDHLLLAVLTGINAKGYRSLDKLKESITEEVKNDKKIAKLLNQAKSAKSIAEASKIKNAVIDTVKHVSFSMPTFVSSTMASEPIIGAVTAKTAKGAFAGPVKGNNGVYMLQVLDKKKTAEKFDKVAEQKSAAQTNFQMASNAIINALYLKADVKDNRYKFF